MKINPRYSHFRSVFDVADAEWMLPWEGDCWRYQDIDFPSGEEILSGSGAFKNGGRLNAKRAFHVVYGSATEETALQESTARARRYGIIIKKPRILICIEMKLKKVIDLRQSSLLKALDITLSELSAENWELLQSKGIESLGQTVGRAAFDSKAEAVIIPSFAYHKGFNIAFFPENKLSKSRCKIIDGEKLSFH